MTYIILIGIVSIVTNFFLIKNSISKKKEYKELKRLYSLNIESENKKTEIREKYDEKESNVVNNNTSNILPDKTKHNHPFKSECGVGCPVFDSRK